MNTFFRYFLHFIIVTLAIIIIIGVIGLFDKMTLNVKVVTATILSVIVFSICMSAIFSNFTANQEQVSLKFKTEEEKSLIIAEN